MFVLIKAVVLFRIFMFLLLFLIRVEVISDLIRKQFEPFIKLLVNQAALMSQPPECSPIRAKRTSLSFEMIIKH